MGKKKNLSDLKKDLKTLKKEEMIKIIGGKKGNKRHTNWNNKSSVGGILPQ